MPISASALIVDIRDFTPTYASFTKAGREKKFLRFIETFLATCLQACRESFRDEPGDRLYLNSTGDGVLAVFEAAPRERAGVHALRAWAAALRLAQRLPKTFRGLGGSASTPERPRFGMGLESGSVSRVGASVRGSEVSTRLGHCINVAARLEAHTKTLAGTALVLGEHANRLLTAELHNGDYDALVKKASAAKSRDERHRHWEKLREANDGVGVLWIGAMNLKGVERPLLAFRTPSLLGSKVLGRAEAALVTPSRRGSS